MGGDHSVVDAARVSMDKVAAFYTDDENAKLTKYLAKHEHTSPFNHAFMSFRVTAPVFVARQLVKHKFLPWNEISRRYVKTAPEFYTPDVWREVAPSVKQGSLATAVESNDAVKELYARVTELTLRAYESMISNGVCPEQARMILPQSMTTSWIWSGSLGAFAEMCRLRLDPHAQYEARLVARQIANKAQELFPIAWPSLLKDKYDSSTD